MPGLPGYRLPGMHARPPGGDAGLGEDLVLGHVGGCRSIVGGLHRVLLSATVWIPFGAGVRSADSLRGVGVGGVVAAEKVFAVVVAVWGSCDAVNVLLGGLVGGGGELAQVGGAVVIELDHKNRALDAVVKDAV